MRSVQDPIIPIVAQLIRDHPGTISLGQGVVSFAPPDVIYDFIKHGMADPDNHKYRPVQGLPALVQLIQAKLHSENGIVLDDQRVVMVTAGSNLAFMNAILAITDPGDEVILLTPYYFNHDMALSMASVKTVLVPTDIHGQPQLAAIRNALTPRTRAVVTVSPNNPTGAVYPEETLRSINRLCAERGVYHIHDEAYECFTYDAAQHFSPGSDPESHSHTISLFSFSKGYGFASWRLGYMVAPTPLFKSLQKIQDTLLICAPVVSQFAAMGALSVGRGWLKPHLESLARVRSTWIQALGEVQDRCDYALPMGAFYFLLRLRTDRDPMSLVRTLVKEFKVAVVPGTAFAAEGCQIRVSYGALTPETATEGIRRLVSGLKAVL